MRLHATAPAGADLHLIDVDIASLRGVAARLAAAAQVDGAAPRGLAAARTDRTVTASGGAQSALVRTRDEWIGFLTGLRAAVDRSAQALHAVADTYERAEDDAGVAVRPAAIGPEPGWRR
ncbi:MAG TPA: hypothetical protein VH561_14555 [Micromonosporaceae bacterium]|jgi:hypothetical protein